MNHKLGKFALEDIRSSLTGRSGRCSAAIASGLAEKYGVSLQTIYSLTADLRPPRKPRSDKGKSAFQLREGSGLWRAMELVVVDKLDPDLALMTIRQRGCSDLPSLDTFRKILREKGLSRYQRKRGARPYRRWEAEFPGQLFQVDITGLKTRWLDLKTRRVLKIEENTITRNHPQRARGLLRVWQVMLLDDFSRRRFLRYIAADAVGSEEVVRFLIEAFAEMGVPHMLYTDNGSEFRGRHKYAEQILNKLLGEKGGYRHITHLPYNARATGKVENAHQWAEKMDKLIGVAKSEGREITLPLLNNFAGEICRYYNEVRIHRTTGQTPIARWHSRRALIRKLPSAMIEAALLADEFEARLTESMAIAHRGDAWQLPLKEPFINFIGQKVRVVIPDGLEVLVVVLPDGQQHTLKKAAVKTDAAGEFKAAAESAPQKLTKRLRETRRETIAEAKARIKEGKAPGPLPFIDKGIEAPASNIRHFPQPEFLASEGSLAKAASLPKYSRILSYWEALAEYRDSFADMAEAKEVLLGIFGGKDGEMDAGTIGERIRERLGSGLSSKNDIAAKTS